MKRKQMALMAALTLVLSTLYLLGICPTSDPEGVAVFGGFGSLALLIASPFWILCRRTVPLWFAFACGLTVVCVATYGGCWASLFSGEAFPHRPNFIEVMADILTHPQDNWLGLVYCMVLTILAAFQKKGQRLRAVQAQWL